MMSSFLSFSLRLRVSRALTRRSAVTAGGARHRRVEVRGAWRTSRANEKHKTRETNVEVDLDGGAPRERRRRVRVLALLLALAHVIQEGIPFSLLLLGLLQVAIERDGEDVGRLQRYQSFWRRGWNTRLLRGLVGRF